MSKDWSESRISYIKGLKAPTDQQRLLLLLWEKPEKSKEDDRKIATLIRAERAVERAQRARAEAAKLISKEAEAARKRRTRRLIELGGIVEIAGAGELDKGTLLGLISHGLSAANSADEDRMARWKKFGDAEIAKREAEKKKSPLKSGKV